MIVMVGRCNSTAHPHSRGRSNFSTLRAHTGSYAGRYNSMFNGSSVWAVTRWNFGPWLVLDKLAVCIDILEHTRGDHIPSFSRRQPRWIHRLHLPAVNPCNRAAQQHGTSAVQNPNRVCAYQEVDTSASCLQCLAGFFDADRQCRVLEAQSVTMEKGKALDTEPCCAAARAGALLLRLQLLRSLHDYIFSGQSGKASGMQLMQQQVFLWTKGRQTEDCHPGSSLAQAR